MKRVLKLSRKGRSFTSPYQLVGAVLLKDDHIIGEGVRSLRNAGIMVNVGILETEAVSLTAVLFIFLKKNDPGML
ncbi:MAG: hypothetical protein L6422_04520 [Candidatus Marinimicrobia bacterium]|nr:hypothetical protein [bacterium]MCG2715540.1 hypothetical protein [Candidatus Neomarinimicrobiota bacterium]